MTMKFVIAVAATMMTSRLLTILAWMIAWPSTTPPTIVTVALIALGSRVPASVMKSMMMSMSIVSMNTGYGTPSRLAAAARLISSRLTSTLIEVRAM